MRRLCIWVAMLLFAAFNVQAVPVTLTNANFEAGSAYEGDSFDDPGQDIPGWMDGYIVPGAYVDVWSGESSWSAGKFAYAGQSADIEPNCSAYLLSTNLVQADQEFAVSFAAISMQTQPSEMTATLFYDGDTNNVIGSFAVAVPTADWVMTTNVIPFTPESVGHSLGILMEVTGGQVVGFDEVAIDVQTVAFSAISGSPSGTISTRSAVLTASLSEIGTTVTNTTTLYVDNQPIPTTVDRSAAPSVSISGVVGHLTDGAHTAKVVVDGADGRSVTEEWTFTVETGAFPALEHRWSFDSDLSDSEGGLVGTAYGDPVIAGGEVAFDGTDDYVDLSGAAIGINGYSDLTLEVWGTMANSGAAYQTLVGFGRVNPNDANWLDDYLIIQPNRGDNVSRVALTTQDATPWAAEDGVNGPEQLGDEHLYTVTVSGSLMTFYVDGVSQGSVTLGTALADNSIANLSNDLALLGKGYAGDGTMTGSVNEFRIRSGSMSSNEVASSYTAGPDLLPDASVAFTFDSQSPSGEVGDSAPTVSVRVIDGDAYFDTGVLYVDGAAVATNDTANGAGNVVSAELSGLANGVHTAKVEVASVDSAPAMVATNTWTFEVVPFVSISGTPTGTLLTNSVTLEGTIVEGSEIVSSATLYLDDVEVSTVVDRSEAPTATMSYIATELYGTHTGKVVVVGDGGSVASNEWTFTTGYEVSVPTSLAHHWDFTDAAGTTVADSVGGADGTIIGDNYSWIPAGGLVLDGGGASSVWNGLTNNPSFTTDSGAYVDLPNGIISAFSNAITIEATYISDAAGVNWQRVYDFGNSSLGEEASGNGLDYVFLATFDGDGPRVAVDDGTEEIFQLESTEQNVGEITHNVFVYDPDHHIAKMYQNGVLIEEEVEAKYWPLSNLDDVNNWIGRAQWGGDPLFDGTLYDLRIYEGVMTASEAADRYDAVSPKLVLESTAPSGAQTTNSVTLEAVVIEGDSIVDTNNIVMTLDGSPVTPVVDRSAAPTTTISYVASDLFVGSHAVTLSVAGDPTGSLYTEWNFAVQGSSSNSIWNVNVAGFTGGTTYDVTDGVVAVAPSSGDDLWNNVIGSTNEPSVNVYTITNTLGEAPIGLTLDVADGVFGYWDATTDNVNQEMFQFVIGTALDVTTTITNLDVNSSYDIYLYSTWRWPGNYTGNEVTTTVLGGYGDDLSGVATQLRTPVQGYDADDYSGCLEGDNYVLLSGVTPTLDGEIVLHTVSSDGSYSGLQIMENPGQAGERPLYELISTTPTGDIYELTPTLEAVVSDIAATVDTNAVVLMLDDSDVTSSASISKVGTTTTVSYVTAELSSGTHTAAVIPVVGGPTNEWTFNVVPFVSVTPTPIAATLADSVALEVTVEEGACTVSNATTLSVDGSPVAATVVRTNAPTAVISGVASGLSVGTHTAQVVVVGSPDGLATNDWTFVVHPTTTDAAWNVNIAGAVGGTTNNVTDGVFAVAPASGSNLWNNVFGVNGTNNQYVVTDTEGGSPIDLSIDVTVGSFGAWDATADDVNQEMFQSTLGTTLDVTATVSGLDTNNAYDVYIYSTWRWPGSYAGNEVYSQVTGGYGDDLSGVATQNRDSVRGYTATDYSGCVDGANYVLLSGVTPTEAGEIVFDLDSNDGSFSGLQIVEHAGEGNIPQGPTESPTIILSTGTSGGLVFTWSDGYSYNVETNADLVNGSWGVYTNVTSPYTNSIGDDTEMFYRLSYE